MMHCMELSIDVYLIRLCIQISSSEYFSVSFDCFEDPGPDEFVAASKGTSLRFDFAVVHLFYEQ